MRPDQPVEDLPASAFNGALLAHVVRSLSDAGWGAKLAAGHLVRPAAAPRGLDTCLEVLEDVGAVTAGPLRTLTDRGRELFRAHGFYTWLLEGNGPMLKSLDRVLAGETVGVDRDWAAVARGSAEAGRSYLDPLIDPVLDTLAPACLADLGCGDASRLRAYLGRHEEATAVGVERSAAAVADAAAARDRDGLTDRLEIVYADCLEASPGPRADVELVTSFLLLHDLLQARDGDMGAVVAAIRHNFPNARTFLLADTTRDAWRSTGDATTPPIFVRGFELVHALMGVTLRTKREYELLFAASGLDLVETTGLDVPNTWLFHLTLPE